MIAGILSVGLAFLGALLPLLPTTPFLLLAAACFARSSARMHRWLHAHRLFGPYLQAYREGRSMTLPHKVSTLLLLWLGIGLSAFLAVPGDRLWLRLALLGIAAAVTVHILRLKTRARSAKAPVSVRD